MLWWEELTGLLQSQPALLKREVSLRQGLIATTLEQLTSDDVLTFSHMEKILSEVQGTLTEGLQQCTEGKMCKVKMVQCGSAINLHFHIDLWGEAPFRSLFV